MIIMIKENNSTFKSKDRAEYSDDNSIPWHSKYIHCMGCGTQRFSHRSKGYCTRCYPLIQKISKIKTDSEKGNISKTIAKVEITIAEKQLHNLKELEKPFLTGIKGKHISGLLTTLARCTGASQKGAIQHFESSALWDKMLSKDAKQWLYLILVDIVEHLPSKNNREIQHEY